MDPYLEGYLWPDVHSALASKIRQILTPLLRPRYAVRLGIYVVEDTAPEAEIGIMYPDVNVMLSGAGAQEHAAMPGADITPAALTIPVVVPVEVAVTNVELRDTASNQLVTCIELLSPVNKREPGITAYRQKRQRFYQAGVHLIEIDLLRRGTRPVAHPRVPATAYLVAVTRAHTGRTDLWPLTLEQPLPTIPVPLRPPDLDVLLPLSAAWQATYEEAAYELSIDYTKDPPPPPLTDVEAELVRKLLESR
jgi:hypothetical protein